MSDPNRQIRETFQAHESLAPDELTVMENVEGRVKGARRRRLALRAAGVSVLGAGIVITGLNVPAWTSHSTVHNIRPASDGSSTAATPTPSPSPSDTTSPAATGQHQWSEAEEFAAYFAGGYDYGNAEDLAQMWSMGDIGSVKAKAGLALLDNKPLPVTPNNTPESTSDQDQGEFFAAGYDSTDAETLAQQWNVGEQQAKTKAGAKLLAGDTLPIQPSDGDNGDVTAVSGTSDGDAGGAATASGLSPALTEFFNAGYDYDDAVQLAKAWNETGTDIETVKAQAGQKLLNGQSLPVQPSDTPATQAEVDQQAFFNAGYDYTDAQALAQKWNETNIDQVKTEAGAKLIAGQTLPVQPSN